MDQRKTFYAAAGIIALCGGLFVVGGVLGLKSTFGYPDIIRAEPGIIMGRLNEMRHIVPYLYYFGIGGAGVCMALFSVLFGHILYDAGERVWSSLGRMCGVVAGVLLFAGILRYSILFPELAALRATGAYDPQLIDMLFRTMNVYAGVSIAEHAQFTFSAFMFLFFGLSIVKTGAMPRWTAYLAFVTSATVVVGNLEPFGFDFAFAFNRTAAKLLAVWMLCAGSTLLFARMRMKRVE